MKHLEPTLETFVYSYCNMCNIPIYFCNSDVIHWQQRPLKRLKHTLATCAFQRNIILLLGGM
jgi:hypothetical protein